ncbi:MAG: zinc-dependent metalloprotease family protein [Marinirhabdus sp.]
MTAQNEFDCAFVGNPNTENSCTDLYSYSTSQSDLDAYAPVVFRIKFWELTEDDGSTPSQQYLDMEKESLEQIAWLNMYYNLYNVFFKYHGVGEIRSTFLYNKNDLFINDILVNPNHYDPNTLNIFVAPNIIGGQARFAAPYTLVSRGAFNNNANTVRHEIGHNFGLDHTFSGWQKNPWLPTFPECEHVTRVDTDSDYNADKAGDYITDTAAIPNFRNEHFWELFEQYMINNPNATNQDGYDYASANYVQFNYFENCTYIDNGDDCQGTNYTLDQIKDVQNLMAYNDDSCNDEYLTIGQAIRIREVIDLDCHSGELTAARYVNQVQGLAALFEPYKGEYYFAGPITDDHKPLFQPGFDYSFIDCDCDCPQPTPFGNGNFSYTNYELLRIGADEQDYNRITHPNHAAIIIQQLSYLGPQRCYDNNNRRPSLGSSVRFNDGIPNANVTITPLDSLQINNPQLINNLQPGLYNIVKQFDNGEQDQQFILKNNGGN